jgi:hypothetical protein
LSWYKIFSGLPTDERLAVIAKRAGVKRGEALAVWLALLDHAATASPRGSIEEMDAETLAVTLEFDPAAVEKVIAALREKNMILPGGMIVGWSRHQPLSTSRTRAFRARRALQETDEARRERLFNNNRRTRA